MPPTTRSHSGFLGPSFCWAAPALALAAFAAGYNTTHSTVCLLPACSVFPLWIAVGLDSALVWLTARPPRPPVAVPLLLIALPLASLGLNYAHADLSHDREAQAYVDRALAELPPDALVIADGDRHTCALWYGRYALATTFRAEVISVGLLQYDWYLAQLARRLPGGALPPPETVRDVAVQQLVRRLIAARPVFVTSAEECLSDTSNLAPVRPLVGVEPK